MQRSFQLSIRHLFYATALIASGLAVHPITILFSVLMLCFWRTVFSGYWQKITFAEIIALLAIAGILIGMLLPAQVSYYRNCKNNMRQLLLGLLNYESVNGNFPPAQMLDEATGKPMHSWRVLILPYIEGGNVYNQYDFDEPWDGPNNSKLVDQMPYAFACPQHNHDGLTTYKLISDTGAAFDAGKTNGISDFHDGLTNTIAMVEDTNGPINWMKPDDVNIETAIKILTENQTHHHVQEQTFQRLIFPASVGMMDGSIVSLDTKSNTIPVLLSSMLIDDGLFTELSTGGPTRIETKWGAYLGLLFHIALAIVPAFFVKKQNKLKIEPTIGAEL